MHGNLSCKINIEYSVFYLSSTIYRSLFIKNKLSTDSRELGGTMEKYVKSKYLLKNYC